MKTQSDEIRELQRQLIRYHALLDKVEKKRDDHNLELLASKRFWAVLVLLVLFMGIATKALITEKYNATRYEQLYEAVRQQYPDMDLEAPLENQAVLPIVIFYQWFSATFLIFWDMISTFLWQLFWAGFRISAVCGSVVFGAVLLFGRMPWVKNIILAIPMPSFMRKLLQYCFDPSGAQTKNALTTAADAMDAQLRGFANGNDLQQPREGDSRRIPSAAPGDFEKTIRELSSSSDESNHVPAGGLADSGMPSQESSVIKGTLIDRPGAGPAPHGDLGGPRGQLSNLSSLDPSLMMPRPIESSSDDPLENSHVPQNC